MLSNYQLNEQKISADFYVSGSSPFAIGHYPSDAIFPGVMSLFLMRQLADTLFGRVSEFVNYGEVALKRVTYLDTVRPGDVLKIYAIVKKITEISTQINVLVEVDGVEKATSSFVYEHALG